ncbi:MAG: transketolase, partial [Muribaculaceae bacterium]|nr:transketolase [Muribaculaceae bacterium]
LITRAADNIRVLIAAMLEKDQSGHPGGAMGGADFVSALYSKYIVYDPENPEWIARDRFFLDPGHMSPMLYGILALTGRYTMDELKEFRQWGSVTPGHPELDRARGVENSSGPLGQGHVMAVGAAIAERFLVAQFGDTVAHKTYAYISDGGIQEEISQGAGRIAGHLGLHNLIMFYDANDVQLSTMVHDVTGEDTAAKYRSWNWNVIEIDGNDASQLCSAIEAAHNETQRPTLIIGHTVMAKGALAADGSSMEGKVSTHGQPLSKAGADIDKTISNLGGDPTDPFMVWNDVADAFAARRDELKAIAATRHEAERIWAEANPELAARLADYIAGRLPEIDYSAIEFKANMASRNASATILSLLAEKVGNMIVSSADLANSDKTDGFLKKTRTITADDFGGRFLQAGVAELTMAAIMNGIALHGGLIAACGTFFVFSDYVKPALRMSALMGLPVKYIFTHDAFRVGEDGPTHEPVEHEAQMRLLEMMDNLEGHQSTLVLRPADSAETAQSWKMAMDNSTSPTVLILSRQDLEDLPALSGNRRAEAAGTEKGGYIVIPADNADITLVANGSEVALLCHVAEKLKADGISASVVSVPSLGLFMRQDAEYRQSVLPRGGRRFGLTAGLPVTLYPIMKDAGEWEVYGLERFGASAPYKVLDQKFGYTVDNIYNQVRGLMTR